MSKGSGRRPASVTEAEIAANYERIFGKNPKMSTCEFIEQVLGVKPEPYQKGIIEQIESGFTKIVIKRDTPDSEK